MKKYLKKYLKINFTLIAIIIGICSAIFLLYKSNFFVDFNIQNFNNIVSPIATILAFVIYYATLIEIKNSNNRNIDFQKISLFKERIENLKIRLERTKIETPIQFLDKIENSENFNLTSFVKLYHIVNGEMRKSIKNGDKDILDYSLFFFSICFDFNLHSNHISKLITEIHDSDFKDLEKTILNEILVKILNDYLYVNSLGKSLAIGFKYTSENNQTIKISGYDAPFYTLPENKLTTVFTYMEFDKVYNLMKEYKMI